MSIYCIFVSVACVLFALLFFSCYARAVSYQIKYEKVHNPYDKTSVNVARGMAFAMLWWLGYHDFIREAIKREFSPLSRLVPTEDGMGYWIVWGSGHRAAFGNAHAHRFSEKTRSQPSMVYKMREDGCVYGDSTNEERFPSRNSTSHNYVIGKVIFVVMTRDGRGAWALTTNGYVVTYGSAQYFGQVGDHKLDYPVFAPAITGIDFDSWINIYESPYGPEPLVPLSKTA